MILFSHWSIQYSCWLWSELQSDVHVYTAIMAIYSSMTHAYIQVHDYGLLYNIMSADLMVWWVSRRVPLVLVHGGWPVAQPRSSALVARSWIHSDANTTCSRKEMPLGCCWTLMITRWLSSSECYMSPSLCMYGRDIVCMPGARICCYYNGCTSQYAECMYSSVWLGVIRNFTPSPSPSPPPPHSKSLGTTIKLSITNHTCTCTWLVWCMGFQMRQNAGDPCRSLSVLYWISNIILDI